MIHSFFDGGPHLRRGAAKRLGGRGLPTMKDAKDGVGRTPLLLAAFLRRDEIFKHLYSLGCRPLEIVDPNLNPLLASANYAARVMEES